MGTRWVFLDVFVHEVGLNIPFSVGSLRENNTANIIPKFQVGVRQRILSCLVSYILTENKILIPVDTSIPEYLEACSAVGS